MRRQSERGALIPCRVCRIMTRPQRASEEDHPGTIPRTTRDTCRQCYMRARSGLARATPEEKRRIKEALHDHTVRGLVNFLAARNERKGVSH